MLYIFYGTNEGEARQKARTLLHGLQQKAPDAELVRITQESVTESGGELHIEHYLDSVGLFKHNYLLYLDGVDDVFLRFSDTQLEAMRDSSHVCVVALGSIKNADIERIGHYATKVTECSQASTTTQRARVDTFAVANALRARNKQALYMALTEARLMGTAPEATVGMLSWAVKDMLLKGNVSKYTADELKDMMLQLSDLPHNARVRGVGIHNALEKFALSVV